MIPYCGECPFMKCEDINGYGYCDVTERTVRCNEPCNIHHNTITPRGAVKILHYAQRWRRGKKIPMPPPYVLGQAIDKSIQTLRLQK